MTTTQPITTEQKLQNIRAGLQAFGEKHDGEPCLCVGPGNFIHEMGITTLDGHRIYYAPDITIIDTTGVQPDIEIRGDQSYICVDPPWWERDEEDGVSDD